MITVHSFKTGFRAAWQRVSLVLTAVALVGLQSTSVLAVSANQFKTENNIFFYEPASIEGCAEGNTTGGGISPTLSANIPADWGALFSAAASKYGTNPNFLAALYLSEQGNTWKNIKSTDWAGSPAGAQGPMQFMPGTWDAYKVDGDGDGVKSINDADDAVFAAGNLVSKSGAKAGTPLGNIERPWKPGTLLYVAATYNWGGGNVQNNTEPNSPLSAGPEETENYLKNIHALITSDFTKSGHPSYRDPAPASPGGDSATPTSPTSSGDECSSGGGVGIANGFVFPLQTTQKNIKEGVDGSRWCYSNMSNCHHHYNAADIFQKTGTPILAVKGGKVVSKTTDACTNHKTGCNITIMGDDKILYYYTHMSKNATPRVGAQVSAQEQLGSVGTNQTAADTTRHLHFDMLPGDKYSSRPECASETCMSYPFYDVQEYLVPAFNALPKE